MKEKQIFGSVILVSNEKNEMAVTDLDGNILVPFGKYSWIDRFDSGLARVNIRENGSCLKKWGIINERGEEVLPVEYDNVWNFYKKNRGSTRVEKNGKSWDVSFYELNPDLRKPYFSAEDNHYYNHYYDDGYDEGEHYEAYSGTYAQDYAGFSDEDIDDVFEGDPDMYWNID